MTWVAPSFFAYSSLAGLASIEIIVEAPAMRQPWRTLRPTPPQPQMAQLVPGRTSAVLIAAPTPVMTPQPIRDALTRGMSLSILMAVFSATTVYSQRPPMEAKGIRSSPST